MQPTWWERSCWFWQVVYWDQWAEIQSWRSSELEDLQSSRKRFGLEHREADLCWSRSESEGRKEKAECHLRRGDGLGNKRKWGYWEEWCTWRRVMDRGQSLGGHRRRKCARRTGRFHILHESSEMTDKIWTSWEQSHGYQTRMREVKVKCAIAYEECRQGDHFPFLCREPV